MIVKMKKLTLLVSEGEREGLLIKLRRLGVLHVKGLSIPSHGEIGSLEEMIKRAESVIPVLKRYSLHSKAEKTALEDPNIPKIVDKVYSVIREREAAERDFNNTAFKMQWFKTWGSFNPRDIIKLKENGIFLRLYSVPKNAARSLKDRKDIKILNRDRQHLYLAQVSEVPDDRLPFEEVMPPNESFEDLYTSHESYQRKIEEIDGILRTAARAQDSFIKYLSALEKRYTFLNVMYGMKEEEKFSYLQGFCPVDKINDISTLSGSEGFGYLVEEPDNPKEVPTLIRNPRWVSIIKPIFNFMNTVPGYKEYDISFPFLIFFSIFFAMLVGDAGYGLIFIALTFLARKKMKKAPPAPFILLYTLSFATVIWGLITGTWFGSEKIAELPFLEPFIIERIGSFVSGNENFMIYLCFIIGIIHLSIARFIVVFRFINTLRALAEVGWIFMMWGLFFTAGTLILEKPFPEVAGYLLIAGAALIILFSNPQRNILKGALISFVNFPLKAVNSFADIVSYLRLFAVGYATVIVATAFNNMAASLGFNSVINGMVAALILFFGHTLNIALCLMAVIVHGVRLNMLEFSGQMGMEWSGKEYSPFREGD